jgi:hypothetical protein
MPSVKTCSMPCIASKHCRFSISNCQLCPLICGLNGSVDKLVVIKALVMRLENPELSNRQLAIGDQQ